MIRQCVILVGGLGTRLGALTQATPKPLLPVSGRPFLEYLIEDAARFGFTRIILLAGHLGGQVVQGFAGRRRVAGRDIVIDVLVEPAPMGTGGALSLLRDIAAPAFLLMNGDSWCDIDLRAFATAMAPDALLRMALRPVADARRFGAVALEAGRVRRFLPRGDAAGGLMNAGIYLVRRDLLARIPEGVASLEADIFPALAAEALIEGIARDAFLIDIGVPEDYAAAPERLARHRRRAAVFLDRDGTLNHDDGYTHRVADLRWLPGARAAVRAANNAGRFVFVVTNQAGVAHGLYGLDAVDAFHARMDEELAEIGAHIDEFRACPFHPEAALAEFRADSACRKPRPGMLLDLAAAWPVDMTRSIMLGDRETDIQAATAAGLRGVLACGATPLDAVLLGALAA